MLRVKTILIQKSLQMLLPSSSLVLSTRHNTNITFLGDVHPSHMAVGRGGRSSFNGKVVTVFGASSFVGVHVVSHLAKIGTQVVIPYRDMFNAKRCKVTADLGQLVFCEYSIFNEKSIKMAMKYSDVVINLIGRHYNEMKTTWQWTNVDAARRLARCAREMGVPHFIHVSALNCDVTHKGFWNKTGSGFLRSKYEGEMAVKEEYPDATIFRPSDIFGERDTFFMSLLSPVRVTLFKKVPIPHRGKGIYKQPVHVINVAQGITYAALNEKITKGITYEAIGPRRYEFYDMIQYLHRVIRRDELHLYYITDAKWSIDLWMRFFLNDTFPIEFFPKRKFNRDRIEREAISDTTRGLPTLVDMGIRLITIEEIAEFTCKCFRLQRIHSQHLVEPYVEAPAKYTIPHQ